MIAVQKLNAYFEECETPFGSVKENPLCPKV
jgi:hypothetical protein